MLATKSRLPCLGQTNPHPSHIIVTRNWPHVPRLQRDQVSGQLQCIEPKHSNKISFCSVGFYTNKDTHIEFHKGPADCSWYPRLIDWGLALVPSPCNPLFYHEFRSFLLNRGGVSRLAPTLVGHPHHPTELSLSHWQCHSEVSWCGLNDESEDVCVCDTGAVTTLRHHNIQTIKVNYRGEPRLADEGSTGPLPAGAPPPWEHSPELREVTITPQCSINITAVASWS